MKGVVAAEIRAPKELGMWLAQAKAGQSAWIPTGMVDEALSLLPRTLDLSNHAIVLDTGRNPANTLGVVITVKAIR